MEAVWTRFHPIAYKLQEEVFGGKYGGVKRIFADLSMDFDLENKPDGHRMIDPALGGGSLMDLAPYPSVWVSEREGYAQSIPMQKRERKKSRKLRKN